MGADSTEKLTEDLPPSLLPGPGQNFTQNLRKLQLFGDKISLPYLESIRQTIVSDS